MFSVPSTFAWHARRDLEPTPTMESSFSFSSRATFDRPLRPSCTKMWQVPQLGSHLWLSAASAPRIAASRVIPSVTSTVLPDGIMVSVDIEPLLVFLPSDVRYLCTSIDCRPGPDIDRGIL